MSYAPAPSGTPRLNIGDQIARAYRMLLDNAQLFFEEGVGSVDLSNVLLPILEAGNLRIILTMDEQRLLQIGQRNPALINALNRIIIRPADKKETIESALNELKEAYKNKDIPAIDTATEKLNAAWNAASEEMYKATQDAQQNGGDANQQQGNEKAKDAEVTDVDFEEVK